METDFERRLREGLQARAAEVTPDPATWQRVQAGIRRRQRLGWLQGGAAVAALAAVAVLALVVVPGQLRQPDVGFEDPGVARQPDGPGTPPDPQEQVPTSPPDGSAAPVAPALVVATPDAVGLLGAEGLTALGGAGQDEASTVAVRPGAPPEDLDVVQAAGCDLVRLVRTPAEVAVSDLPRPDGVGCAAGPRFSPDGEALAWVEGTGEDGFTLAVTGWDDGPVAAREARFELQGLDGVGDLRVAGWTWTGAEGGAVSGFVVLAGVWQDGAASVATLPIERQGDGALALPGGAEPVPFDAPGQRVLAFQHGGCPLEGGTACPQGVAWTVERTEGGAPVLVRSDEGEQLRTADLDEVALDGGDLTTGPVWLEVVGETAVVGDGAGRAWVVTWDDPEADEQLGAALVEELAADEEILHGAALRAATGAAAEPGEGGAADPAEEPAWLAELPEPVRQTRADLLAAAASGDLEALRPLLPDDGFTFSYGAEEDPIAYWRERQAEGLDVLGLLGRLLELPPVPVGEDVGFWVWPFAYDRPHESLSSAELTALEEAIGPEAVAAYEESGTYLHHRVGIAEDGTWRYFVAGD